MKYKDQQPESQERTAEIERLKAIHIAEQRQHIQKDEDADKTDEVERARKMAGEPSRGDSLSV
jgi:hypothetical protein